MDVRMKPDWAMTYSYDGQPPLPHQPRMEHTMWSPRLGWLNYLQDRLVSAASDWVEALAPDGSDTKESLELEVRRKALEEAMVDYFRL